MPPLSFHQPFRPRGLASDPGTKAGLLIAQPYAEEKLLRRNSLIINEYGGLWLTRDGLPTRLAQRSYGYLTEPATPPAERARLYARTMAAFTEFFRAHRQAAGVLHFTALGYSRPDGTSQNRRGHTVRRMDVPGPRLDADCLAT
jgi:hypothetical protein